MQREVSIHVRICLLTYTPQASRRSPWDRGVMTHKTHKPLATEGEHIYR